MSKEEIDPIRLAYFKTASESVATMAQRPKVTAVRSLEQVIKYHQEQLEILRGDCRFLELYCDCSDMFDVEKLKAALIKLHVEELQKYLRKGKHKQ
ncbi:MAG TPA: hypothetical protein PLA71_01190 [Saccharofermentans sp.]|nr:hypothetical protein [Saccharofermentans sp.]